MLRILYSALIALSVVLGGIYGFGAIPSAHAAPQGGLPGTSQGGGDGSA